jgi:hypothetical protein
MGGSPRRAARVYVFCLFGNERERQEDVLDLGLWRFFVISTAALERAVGEQKTIRLGTVERLAVPADYAGLRVAVDRALVAVEGEPRHSGDAIWG